MGNDGISRATPTSTWNYKDQNDMASLMAALKRLKQTLSELEEARGELERLPRRVAIFERRIAEAETAAEAQKAVVTQLRKAADELSLQLKTNEQTIVTSKGKLNQAGSNREYDIITQQIRQLESRNQGLEDEILVALDRVDAAKAELSVCEAAVVTAKENAKQAQADVEAQVPRLREAEERLAAAAKEECKIIPGNHAPDYRRMVNSVGSRTLSEVENNSCSECYSRVSPQQEVLLNTDKYVVCMQCHKILFRVPAEEADVAAES